MDDAPNNALTSGATPVDQQMPPQNKSLSSLPSLFSSGMLDVAGSGLAHTHEMTKQQPPKTLTYTIATQQYDDPVCETLVLHK